MSKKMIVIEDCYECEFNFDNLCQHHKTSDREIKNPDVIPDWCPLPDYPEETLPLPPGASIGHGGK